MNVSTIRTGIKNRLAVVTGLSVFDRMPGNMQPPAAVVYPSDPFITPQETMGRGSGRINFSIVVYVGIGDWPAAQDQLDGFLSSTTGGEATSILDALLSTTTVTDAALGGAGSLFIEQVGQYGVTGATENSPEYLSAAINLYLALDRS